MVSQATPRWLVEYLDTNLRSGDDFVVQDALDVTKRANTLQTILLADLEIEVDPTEMFLIEKRPVAPINGSVYSLSSFDEQGTPVVVLQGLCPDCGREVWSGRVRNPLELLALRKAFRPGLHLCEAL